jgi:hypothetical protein
MNLHQLIQANEERLDAFHSNCGRNSYTDIQSATKPIIKPPPPPPPDSEFLDWLEELL